MARRVLPHSRLDSIPRRNCGSGCAMRPWRECARIATRKHSTPSTRLFYRRPQVGAPALLADDREIRTRGWRPRGVAERSGYTLSFRPCEKPVLCIANPDPAITPLMDHGPEPRLAVLVPCFNEELTVARVVEDFRRNLP